MYNKTQAILENYKLVNATILAPVELSRCFSCLTPVLKILTQQKKKLINHLLVKAINHFFDNISNSEIYDEIRTKIRKVI